MVGCCVIMELLHPSLNWFQMQQGKMGMLCIGILKLQPYYFDHLCWQQIYIPWECLYILKEPKTLGNSLSEGSVVGQVAISDYKIVSPLALFDSLSWH